MTSLDGEYLFDSGPHRIAVGGESLRHTVYETPGGGVRVGGHGVTGRPIRQSGTLRADTHGELHWLLDRIRCKLDGQTSELVDHHGTRWSNLVMLKVDVDEPRPLGLRWAVDYRIDYLQVSP